MIIEICVREDCVGREIYYLKNLLQAQKEPLLQNCIVNYTNMYSESKLTKKYIIY